jgi:hypothetical protein
MSKYGSTALRSRLTFANVVALLALFVALGGTSVAAVTLANNSVKSKHIARGNVKRSDIGNNAVNSAKVAAGSLTSSDFAAGQIPAGPAGPAGAKGETGDVGPQGPAGSVAMLARMNAIPDTFVDDTTFGSPTGTSTASTSEDSVSMVSPDVALTASNLVVSLTVAVENNSARRFTLSLNGADTTLSCTIGSLGTSCTSAATVAVPARSLLSIKSNRPGIVDSEGTEARIAFRLKE